MSTMSSKEFWTIFPCRATWAQLYSCDVGASVSLEVTPTPLHLYYVEISDYKSTTKRCLGLRSFCCRFISVFRVSDVPHELLLLKLQQVDRQTPWRYPGEETVMKLGIHLTFCDDVFMLVCKAFLKAIGFYCGVICHLIDYKGSVAGCWLLRRAAADLNHLHFIKFLWSVDCWSWL